MAPGAVPDGGGRPANSILNLDKSTEPWPVLLAKVTEILGTDVGDDWEATLTRDGYTGEQVLVVPDPRVDWALRWLLKNLQSAGDQPSAPCRDYRSWMLLSQLVIRSPKATVARLLSAHQFINILEKTFCQIREATVQMLLHQSSDGKFKPESEESSSEPIQSHRPRVPKKRKRHLEAPQTPSSANSSRFYFILFSAACSAVRQIVNLAKVEQGQPEDFAVEHLKHALKSSVTDISSILGTAFFMASHELREQERHPDGLNRNDGIYHKIAFQPWIFPMIDLWSLHSIYLPDMLAQKHHAFFSHCLVPSLQFLHTCHELDTLLHAAIPTMKSLEKLLIENVILPYRASFSDEGSTGIEDKSDALSLSDSLVSVLQDYPMASRGREDWRKTQQHLTVTMLSLLYDVSIKCLPRHTPKLRQAENPWLEQMFRQIDLCAGKTLPPTSPVRAQKDHVKLLKWLLSKAVDNQIRLNVSTIEKILTQVSGLFDDAQNNQVDWSLVGLCLQINANVFVVPSPSETTDSEYSYRSPNTFLKSLISRLTELKHKDRQDYELKIQNVVIPLLEAFVNARDFLGFLEHWKEQLNISQTRNLNSEISTPSGPDLSIWEDEDVLASAANLIESSLTVNQVEEVLLKASVDITSSGAEETQILLGDVVVLDCVCSGLAREGYLNNLSSTAQSVFTVVGNLLCGLPHLSSRHKRRLWRILGTIAERWPLSEDASPFKQKAHAAISLASELINRIESWKSTDKVVYLTKHLQAFKFITSYATIEDRLWQDLQFSSRQRAVAAVRKILEVMGPFCQRITNDHFGMLKMKLPEKDKASFNFTTGVGVWDSVDAFYLGCISYMLATPTVFGCLDVDIRRNLVEQAYACALYERRHSIDSSLLEINYAWPWKAFLSSSDVGENRDLMKVLSTFQVDHYLSLSEFRDPKYWDIGSPDYALCFGSLQALSTKTLGREQRTRLANRTVWILLCANMSNFANMNDHLALLARLIDRPNNSIAILNNAKGRPKEDSPSSGAKRQIALLDMAQSIDDFVYWQTDTLHCVNALRKITRLVLSYLFSTVDQENSIQYLKALFDQLYPMLKSKYEEKQFLGTAISAVSEIVLNMYHMHYTEAIGSLQEEMSILATARQYHLEICLVELDHVIFSPTRSRSIKYTNVGTPEGRSTFGVGLEMLAAYADLLRIHPRLAELTKDLGQIKYWEIVEGIPSVESLGVGLAKLELLLSAGDWSLDPYIVDIAHMLDMTDGEKVPDDPVGTERRVFKKVKSPEGRKQITQCLQKAVSGLKLEAKVDLLDELTNGCIQTMSGGHGQLSLLQAIIHSADEQDLEAIRPKLSRAFTSLCKGMSENFDYRKSMLAMQCISMMLQNQVSAHHIQEGSVLTEALKHRIITQFHIDTLLSSVKLRSTRLESQIEDKHSAMQYRGLCRLFSSILTMHRPKIGGRYHIVLPALQALLRCLFIPYSKSPSSSGPSSAFGESDAAAYARLLSTLCDPTVSAVTRAKKRSRTELNDATKKARSIAGQHLPSLIMEYCRCQLKGKLTPETRAALNPGLWVILGVMRPEVMRTMNTAMDSSSRSAFKVLYDDWKRFGRWEGG